MSCVYVGTAPTPCRLCGKLKQDHGTSELGLTMLLQTIVRAQWEQTTVEELDELGFDYSEESVPLEVSRSDVTFTLVRYVDEDGAYHVDAHWWDDDAGHQFSLTMQRWDF